MDLHHIWESQALRTYIRTKQEELNNAYYNDHRKNILKDISEAEAKLKSATERERKLLTNQK